MMHFRCIDTILLVTVVIAVAMATISPDIIVKKPFGSKMCERLCNRIAGCSSYIYRRSDLSCHLTPSMLHDQEKIIYPIIVRKDKERMHAENAVNCSEGEQIFRTRGHGIKCRTILPNLLTLTNKEDATGGRMTRILMMPYSFKRPLPGRQLYLTNNSVVAYPFLNAKFPVALAYIPSQRKLIMSTIEPNLIVLVTIDTKEKTVLKTKNSIEGIAIDNEKQLMFMNIDARYSGVGVMTTHDQNLKYLVQSPCQTIANLVADCKRSLIYILCRSSAILQFTYKGVPKGRVAEIENVGISVLYMQEDILYHQTKTQELVQISLSDRSVTKLPIKMLQRIMMLLKVGNLLYMLPARYTGDILVVNMSDMATVTKLNMGFGKDVVDAIMCLIP